MPSERDLLTLLRALRGRLDADVSLDALATRAGWSPFHLHRAFRRMVFTRAFRRHFGRTPATYRATALAGASPEVRARHRAMTDATGPCVGLFHLSVNHPHPIRAQRDGEIEVYWPLAR